MKAVVWWLYGLVRAFTAGVGSVMTCLFPHQLMLGDFFARSTSSLGHSGRVDPTFSTSSLSPSLTYFLQTARIWQAFCRALPLSGQAMPFLPGLTFTIPHFRHEKSIDEEELYCKKPMLQCDHRGGTEYMSLRAVLSKSAFCSRLGASRNMFWSRLVEARMAFPSTRVTERTLWDVALLHSTCEATFA